MLLRGGRNSNPIKWLRAARDSATEAHATGGDGDATGAPGGAAPHSADDGRTLPPAPGGPRAKLARALADCVAEALAGGDAGAARVALDALGRLTGELGEGGPVVDLAAERRRRGES